MVTCNRARYIWLYIYKYLEPRSVRLKSLSDSFFLGNFAMESILRLQSAQHLQPTMCDVFKLMETQEHYTKNLKTAPVPNGIALPESSVWEFSGPSMVKSMVPCRDLKKKVLTVKSQKFFIFLKYFSIMFFFFPGPSLVQFFFLQWVYGVFKLFVYGPFYVSALRFWRLSGFAVDVGWVEVSVFRLHIRKTSHPTIDLDGHLTFRCWQCQ